jgi:hypothetical protein
MAKFITEPSDYHYLTTTDGTETINLISKPKFDSFNEHILGLGKIDVESVQVNAISVLFDLEGFTNFCKQIDPQLAVPEYLSEFLKWLFSQIRTELLEKTYAEGYSIYAGLPFFAKFMGDGILFLWDTHDINETTINNIVVSMYQICDNYRAKFLKQISKKVASPPSKLRCGIARGAIYSVGNGNDYVGPCINMSARLQKLNSLSFCFSRRGINPEANESLNKLIITKKTDIRGIGSEELVCVVKKEFDKLAKIEKDKFIDP